MTLTFQVAGVPVPKGRPRTVRARGSGKVVTYTPRRTQRWEDAVRLAAQAACSRARWKPLPGRYEVEIVVRRARRAGDADNFAKAIGDAMNRVVYPDDGSVFRQIVEIVDGAKPGVTVTVTRREAA